MSCSECADRRGLLVSAGAGKALLNLSLEDNTEEGKYVASQALAKLTITADPRLTFPGERVGLCQKSLAWKHIIFLEMFKANVWVIFGTGVTVF